MHYQVKDKQFNNKFLAATEASKVGTDIHFDLYEEAFDKVSWAKEPDLTWDTLLDMRARQIEARGIPIVFHFSGGTDSYTIYKVFERNNIHIDMVYTRAWDTERENQQQVFELTHNNFYDKTTKVVVRDGTSAIRDDAYLDPDWIWTKGYRYQYGIVCTGDEEANDHAAKILGTDNFISILGFEKPRLHFDETGVYSYQDDENYVRTMTDPRLDCFYISPELPELHVKQSYMLLNYIKRLRPYATHTNQLTAFNKIHVPSKFNWLDYSLTGCGRFGDINMSDTSHLSMENTKLYIPSRQNAMSLDYQGRAKPWFESFSGTVGFKNYVSGILNVANDTAGKYLMQDPNNFYSMRQFRSKHYKLTF
jgi:hypothetical protein